MSKDLSRTFSVLRFARPKTLCILAALAAAPAARADQPAGRLELGATTGAYLFSGQSELGVNDSMDVPALKSFALFGLRLGYSLTPRIGVEAEVVAVPTKDDGPGNPALVTGERVQLLWEVAPRGRLRPFLLIGAGVVEVVTDGTEADEVRSDNDFAAHVGAGLKLDLDRKWALRVDARNLVVADRKDGGLADEYEFSAGLQYRFGGDPPPPPPPPRRLARRPAPRAPLDRDEDGLDDEADQCPTKAEDADEFEDDDGCPDPDNDDDGVVDRDDKCASEPESRNGYQDDDGCPDEIIRELAGITFARGSDRIDPDSLPILHRAVEVLAAHPDMKVEIAGHTSNEGNREHNVQLSARRAEEVRAYLVAAGIAGDRIKAVGYGPDKPIADNDTSVGRAENRRIEFRVVIE